MIALAPAEQRRLSLRWVLALGGVVVVWLLLGYVTFGLGSYIHTCLMTVPSLPNGAAYCGDENPSLVLLHISVALKPLSIAIFATGFIFALAYLLGRPHRLAWLLGLFAWTAGLFVMGAMAPQTIVCDDAVGGSTATCFSGWRPGWEWLTVWLLGTVIVVMASRFVRLSRGSAKNVKATDIR